VIACVALFVALAGTAIAARDEFGAKEIKQLNVREERHAVPASASAPGYQVIVRCKPNEQFMGGGGGWLNESSAPPERPTVLSELAVQKRRGGPAKGYLVTGSNPAGFANTLVAQAYCLPK
jgi:hypothetical protein